MLYFIFHNCLWAGNRGISIINEEYFNGYSLCWLVVTHAQDWACVSEPADKKNNWVFSSTDYSPIQCLWSYIGTSAFADVCYLMADFEAKFYVSKCTEHQPKWCYWPMLVNIISQMLPISTIKVNLVFSEDVTVSFVAKSVAIASPVLALELKLLKGFHPFAHQSWTYFIISNNIVRLSTSLQHFIQIFASVVSHFIGFDLRYPSL